MGAGIDAYQQASRMGISADQTVAYSKDRVATRAAFSATAQNTSLFSRGSLKSTAYSKKQKHAAADKYDPDRNGQREGQTASQIVDDITL
jgi:hypothetical protein